jgi:glucosamine-6-phosphate deaminase
MPDFSLHDLYEWCRIPFDQLERHPQRKIPFRLCRDSVEMGAIMARELVDEIVEHNRQGKSTRAIIPCGPSCWYEPFTDLVNREGVSLHRFEVFHMDECLDWQNRELPRDHPYSFRGFMERWFYAPVDPALAVPEGQRHWLNAQNVEQVQEAIWKAPIDITYGGWGQDGHVAYNQTRRHPYSEVSLEELRQSSIRVQENNWDTVVALAQRTLGMAYQFVPPMSVTLGMRECLAAKKVRLFSDTGAWKQTALRVALFGPQTASYPITLLQGHPDALLTATEPTAMHPISQHPEWDLGLAR